MLYNTAKFQTQAGAASHLVHFFPDGTTLRDQFQTQPGAASHLARELNHVAVEPEQFQTQPGAANHLAFNSAWLS